VAGAQAGSLPYGFHPARNQLLKYTNYLKINDLQYSKSILISQNQPERDSNPNLSCKAMKIHILMQQFDYQVFTPKATPLVRQTLRNSQLHKLWSSDSFILTKILIKNFQKTNSPDSSFINT
jgi:hypothetical protein